MSSTVGFSGVGGVGLTIVDKSEPDITVVTMLGRSKVYIRRTEDWKEAVAEFILPQHAEFFADALRNVINPLI